MAAVHVWTKQHRHVWEELKTYGRYIVKEEYIRMALEGEADLMLIPYQWLVSHSPHYGAKPADVTYPVWVSFQSSTAMLPDDNEVILELLIDEEMIASVNIAKWGMILNYSYIPEHEADASAHQKLLALYGTSDARAVMTPFYPELKQEIMGSWPRLFDSHIMPGNDLSYGIIWEVKKEWVVDVKQ